MRNAYSEANNAARAAQWEAYKQAEEMGAIGTGGVRKIWNTTLDNRERPSHNKIDGQVRALDEPFRTEAGHLLMYPGDTSLGAPAEEVVQCRCHPQYKVDWLKGVE